MLHLVPKSRNNYLASLNEDRGCQNKISFPVSALEKRGRENRLRVQRKKNKIKGK